MIQPLEPTSEIFPLFFVVCRSTDKLLLSEKHSQNQGIPVPKRFRAPVLLYQACKSQFLETSFISPEMLLSLMDALHLPRLAASQGWTWDSEPTCICCRARIEIFWISGWPSALCSWCISWRQAVHVSWKVQVWIWPLSLCSLCYQRLQQGLNSRQELYWTFYTSCICPEVIQ